MSRETRGTQTCWFGQSSPRTEPHQKQQLRTHIRNLCGTAAPKIILCRDWRCFDATYDVREHSCPDKNLTVRWRK